MIRLSLALALLAMLWLSGSVVAGTPAPLSPPGALAGSPLVVKEGCWCITSRAINRFTAIQDGADGETWLGTPLGVKRVTPRGERLNTSRDGLPSGAVVALAGGTTSELWCVVLTAGPGRRLHLGRLDRPHGHWSINTSPKIGGTT